MRNPLTGNPGDGFFQRYSIKCFYHMNDLGIGTDGGGSVLAPALEPAVVRFYQFSDRKRRNGKISSGLYRWACFFPICRIDHQEWELLKETVRTVLHLPEDKEKASCILASDKSTISWKEVQKISYPDLDSDRETLIRFLKDTLSQCDFMVSYEGPVDVRGMGDSIFGHFDPWTAKRQREAGKVCCGLPIW